MRRYRKGDTFKPPTAAESAVNADALEGFRRRPPTPQDLSPVGQALVVKTPSGGIAARSGTTLTSAVCTRCIETSTAGTRTLKDTDEQIVVFNLYSTAVTGSVYVTTNVTASGTRYVEPDYPTPQVVKVYQDGGVAGDEVTTCTWTYTIKNLAGDELTTGLTPHKSRYANTTYTKAPDGSYGWALEIEGSWVLLMALQEIAQTDTCT